VSAGWNRGADLLVPPADKFARLMPGEQPSREARVTKLLSEAQVERFRRDGYLFPIRATTEEQALSYRRKLEAVETDMGGKLTGAVRHKPHLLFTWLDQIVHNARILDAVEDLLGPNLLCWASSFFTKEARDPAFVSWHQDSTYWGLSEPDVVTAWVALTPSTVANGCMRVIPGSHKLDQLPHVDTHAKLNMLSRGQEIQVTVDESQAVDVELQPGEISLHHVRLIHGSPPNPSDDRRIGFAVRYVPTHVRQVLGPRDSALLVRGQDRHHNFELETRPLADMHPDAVALHKRVTELHAEILYQGTERRAFS